MSNSATRYTIRRGSEGWRRRYEGVPDHTPSALGADPPCADPDTCPCDVRELWPYAGETQEQFKARLKVKYNWPAMAQEAITS